jgi:hypothetical protein
MPCAIADDLLRWGWIKPAAESGVHSAEWIARQREELGDDVDLTCYYVLIAKGHFILSPPAQNVERLGVRLVGEISHQDAPNFDFRGKKGLHHVRWGMHKRVTPLHEDVGYRHYRYSVDSETIVALGNHWVEAVGWMGQSPWDVGREART